MAIPRLKLWIRNKEDDMTSIERDWLLKVHGNSNYKIVVDNDCIWIDNIANEECVFTFNSFGQDFIVDLLSVLGYPSEHC